ncbi:hypothetical protein PA08_0490 [Cutibacterium modestum P08]|nr:hypothetical protein PA08_0490 [Cutibacterium modestum P08]
MNFGDTVSHPEARCSDHGPPIETGRNGSLTRFVEFHDDNDVAGESA